MNTNTLNKLHLYLLRRSPTIVVSNASNLLGLKLLLTWDDSCSRNVIIYIFLPPCHSLQFPPSVQSPTSERLVLRKDRVRFTFILGTARGNTVSSQISISPGQLRSVLGWTRPAVHRSAVPAPTSAVRTVAVRWAAGRDGQYGLWSVVWGIMINPGG